MTKYQEIVFMQNENAEEALKILNEQGEEAAMNHLKQWDYGENEGEIYEQNPGGSNDHIYRQGDCIMTYNESLGYIGLCRIINEENQK